MKTISYWKESLLAISTALVLSGPVKAAIHPYQDRTNTLLASKEPERKTPHGLTQAQCAMFPGGTDWINYMESNRGAYTIDKLIQMIEGFRLNGERYLKDAGATEKELEEFRFWLYNHRKRTPSDYALRLYKKFKEGSISQEEGEILVALLEVNLQRMLANMLAIMEETHYRDCNKFSK